MGIFDYAPELIIADFSQPISILKGIEDNTAYPTIDIDAVLSAVVEYLEKPMSFNRCLWSTINYLLSEIMSVGEEGRHYSELKYKLMWVVIGCHNELNGKLMYIENRFPYGYKCRRGGAVVLSKHQSICL